MTSVKSLFLLFIMICALMSSCSPSTQVMGQTDTTIASPATIPTATFTFVIQSAYTPTSIISETRVNLSPELYLDESSSPDNLQGEPQYQDYDTFDNAGGQDEGNGGGFVYHFGDEEWVTALTWTRIFPFSDNLHPSEGELRQHYVQVWKDGKMLYSYPVDGICCQPKRLVRYEDHWIFWFMDDWSNHGWVVQDGIMLNELHSYDNAFSVFLLNGKPFFFFSRGDQFGISFDGQEILLSYPNISYGPICCETGGTGRWNPRGTDKMVGFYVKRGETDYQYVEIGLR